MLWRFFSLLILVSALAAASPTRRVADELPRLSDTLAVAKSPFEPITLPQATGSSARHESPTTVSLDGADSEKRHIQTTRSTQSTAFNEQEKDTTPIRDDQTVAASEDSSSSAAATTEPSTITTQAASTGSSSDASGDETTTAAETEAATTVSTKGESRQAEVDNSTSTTPSPATDITLGTTTTPTTEAPSTSAGRLSEEKTTTTEAPSGGGGGPETQSPAVEAAAITGAPPATTTTSGPEPSIGDEDIKRVEEQSKPLEKEKEDAPAPEAEATTLNPPAPTIEAAAGTTTTAAPIVDSSAAASTEQPTATTTTSIPETTEASTTTTTTAKPIVTEQPEPPKQEDKKEELLPVSPSCNHLPSYGVDEVQKVFREETTFRNGTIKGKFTYINFDQRYRLVHYTRLPYGPVKIDLVEELGRPEPATASNSTRSSSSSPATGASSATNEIPNAVLQLRNILPNSLFGFPFVAPNKPLDPRDGASSPGSSFYSTEPLSTPNLLSPNVPVSTLGGRRESEPAQAAPGAAQDTLSQNLNDNIALSVDAAPQAISRGAQTSKPLHTAGGGAAPWDLPPPVVGISSPANNLQFQYALASHANQLGDHSGKQQNSGAAYSYFSGPGPSTQYQYSALPLYTFQQPSYFSAHHHSLPIQAANIAIATPAVAKSATLMSHQPHDHEHYIAPFMLSQTPNANERLDVEQQPTRLKLRVKSAKSLNHNSNGIKSAQLRADESGQQQQQHYQHHSSPVQTYRHSANNNQGRHRAGKQNQDLKPTINSTPVVYHVLRSPLGRLYSLPQYRNAVAYDLDE